MKKAKLEASPKPVKQTKKAPVKLTAAKPKTGCTFVWHKTPDAQKVLLAGDFTNWNLFPMEKSNGKFQASLELPPGEYRYKFVVDGIWYSDPSAEESMVNEYGTRDSLIRVE